MQSKVSFGWPLLSAADFHFLAVRLAQCKIEESLNRTVFVSEIKRRIHTHDFIEEETPLLLPVLHLLSYYCWSCQVRSFLFLDSICFLIQCFIDSEAYSPSRSSFCSPTFVGYAPENQKERCFPDVVPHARRQKQGALCHQRRESSESNEEETENWWFCPFLNYGWPIR